MIINKKQTPAQRVSGFTFHWPPGVQVRVVLRVSVRPGWHWNRQESPADGSQSSRSRPVRSDVQRGAGEESPVHNNNHLLTFYFSKWTSKNSTWFIFSWHQTNVLILESLFCLKLQIKSIDCTISELCLPPTHVLLFGSKLTLSWHPQIPPSGVGKQNVLHCPSPLEHALFTIFKT